jgi:hypothetical protein
MHLDASSVRVRAVRLSERWNAARSAVTPHTTARISTNTILPANVKSVLNVMADGAAGVGVTCAQSHETFSPGGRMAVRCEHRTGAQRTTRRIAAKD